ncbi:hypothetical protein [Agaribacter marinus]|uniref:Uncharacterized protein n=1 Tax=Agaribacter marinus TaxID=1431249 RepID=A0AA37WJC2_9ALTE|nr:hypothetical protein [Agaribacter marinus]GLR69590.1 hypothetical protein GCM10007852_04980 [Agaribacter marinus]
MSDQYESISNEDLMALWLDNQLNDKQRAAFEQRCLNDDDFAELVQSANQTSVIADTAKDFELPTWDKENSFNFEKYKKVSQPWWQWQGLPLSSVVCSFVAIFMVLTDLNIESRDGRFSIGFGSQLPQETINKLVEQKLNDKLLEQQKTNQVLFAQYLQTLQNQQTENSTQLTQYLLTSSRQERREDFAELIKYVNDQRRDDQLFYANQLKDFQQELSFQVGQRPNYTSPNSGDFDSTQLNDE